MQLAVVKQILVLIVYYGWYHGSGYNCHVYSSGSVIYKLASCVIDVLLYYYYMYNCIIHYDLGLIPTVMLLPQPNDCCDAMFTYKWCWSTYAYTNHRRQLYYV